MCGIVGWLGPNIDKNICVKLLDKLIHRGPDDYGEYYSDGLWFGHRRLSIFDLSSHGKQPMISPRGRYVITYNGEIFNYKELKSLLDSKYTFKTQTDTEVLLACIEAYGLDETLLKINGFFAFGLYDLKEQVVYLVRDRMGKKPLYYTNDKNSSSFASFAFASELQCFKDLPFVDKSINENALKAYLSSMCVPQELSMLSGVNKLLPGHILKYDLRTKTTSIKCYWNLIEIANNKVLRKNKDKDNLSQFESYDKAKDNLEDLLVQSINMRLQADVPVGVFLSGGIDSSLVLALANKVSNQDASHEKIQTYSIGFNDKENNEALYAAKIAKHLNTSHHELYLDEKDVLDNIEKIVSLYDEPFADNSSIPTYLLSKFARNDVTVALSGDGGDELFGGYPRYHWADTINSIKSTIGQPLTNSLSYLLSIIPNYFIDFPFEILGRYKEGYPKYSSKVKQFAKYLSTSGEDFYNEIFAVFENPDEVLLAPGALVNSYINQDLNKIMPDFNLVKDFDFANQMMALDQKHYLVDDILTKVDRASMAVSLEVRNPILDYRVLEYSWDLPFEYKVHKHLGKRILRDILYKYVPKELIERPKKGFGMPIDKWLRTGLKDWAADLLSPSSIKQGGYFDMDVVQKLFSSHLKGENNMKKIWTILMFQQWLINWQKI